MILKLCKGDDRKLFFSGVTQARSQKVNVTSMKELEELAAKADFSDFDPLPTTDEQGGINLSFHWIFICPGDKVIAYSGEAYLINEANGKTIERL